MTDQAQKAARAVKWRDHTTVERIQYEDGSGELCHVTYRDLAGLEVTGNGSLQAPLTVRAKPGAFPKLEAALCWAAQHGYSEAAGAAEELGAVTGREMWESQPYYSAHDWRPKAAPSVTGYDEAAQSIRAGKAQAFALWVLLTNESERDGFHLKPMPWEGPGEYQHVKYDDGRDGFVMLPSGKRLPKGSDQ